eukprot:gene3871-2744_t
MCRIRFAKPYEFYFFVFVPYVLFGSTLFLFLIFQYELFCGCSFCCFVCSVFCLAETLTPVSLEDETNEKSVYKKDTFKN